MPKVIFVNRFFHPDHSATSQILSDLAFHLAGQGIDVGIVTSQLRYDSSEAMLPAFERIRGVDIHRVRTTAFGRRRMAGRLVDYASFYMAAARKLSEIVRAGDIVVAKTDPPLVSLVAHRVARRKSARFVNWVQDLYPETAQQLGVRLLRGPAGQILSGLRDNSLRSADANVAIGEIMAERLARSGAARERINVIPNWVDETAIRPVAPAANTLRREWGLSDRFVVAYSGNLGRAHEYETLLAAAELLRDEARLAFLFIGGGHHADQLAAEVDRRGLGHLFVMQPYQPYENLSESLSVGDAHWISLRPELEGLIVPSKIYGIAAAGRPVIAVCDPQGEIGSLVARYDCGIAVQPGDGARLAAVIRYWMGAPEVCGRLGANARSVSDGGASRDLALQLWTSLIRTLSGRLEP